MAHSHISWLTETGLFRACGREMMSALGPVTDTAAGALDQESEDPASGFTLPLAGQDKSLNF